MCGEGMRPNSSTRMRATLARRGTASISSAPVLAGTASPVRASMREAMVPPVAIRMQPGSPGGEVLGLKVGMSAYQSSIRSFGLASTSFFQRWMSSTR